MDISNFIKDVLVPEATKSLQSFYQKYCDGSDIGIELKRDETPASHADRETEKILRDLIMVTYPEHGIWGEELGAYNVDREIVWVLDPLDGTREFLAKKPDGFGNLIGVLKKGRAIDGAISDPINGVSYTAKSLSYGQYDDKLLLDSVIACTNVQHMFEENFSSVLIEKSKKIVSKLNCMGGVAVMEGRADAFVENDLCLHDIVPMLPVMIGAGLTVIDFDGNDYKEAIFDMPNAGDKRYGVIVTGTPSLAYEIFELYRSVS